MSLTYYDLSPDLQELVSDVQVFIRDIDEDVDDRLLDNDSWARILRYVIREFNVFQPVTSFSIDSFPTDELHMGVLQLGLAYRVASAITNGKVEDLAPQGYAGPYFDTSQLQNRWQSREVEARAAWADALPTVKLEHLPMGVGTVLYGFSGPGSSYAGILQDYRGLPPFTHDGNPR